MDNQPKQGASPNLVLWVIWFALTSAVFSYFLVLKLTGSESETVHPPDDVLVKILAGMGLVCIATSFGIRQIVTLPRARKLTPETFQGVMSSCIVSWALAEAVAIYGLVLGLQGAPMSTYGMFMVASFGTMVFLSPNFAPLKLANHP